MNKIVILGGMQQQAEALGTQFQPIRVLYNRKSFTRNLNEMKSSDRIKYIPYSASNRNQEFIVLRRLIDKISPDIVYVNSIPHLIFIGSVIRISNRFSTRPIVMATSHTPSAWRSAPKRLLISFLLNAYADGIFTLAKFQEKHLLKIGISPKKIRTISNAVDTDQFSPNITDPPKSHGNYPVLINIATLTPRKGQDILIKAMRLVKKDYPKIKLVLTGEEFSDTEYGTYLNKLIIDCQVEDNVINVGDIEHSEVPKLIRSSDISLVPSLSELCPFVVLESLATGKVTIATNVGGIPDLIKNESNGFLVAPGDVEGFADCILRVTNDPSLKASIEENARISATEKFSFDVIGEKHREFLSRLSKDLNRQI